MIVLSLVMVKMSLEENVSSIPDSAPIAALSGLGLSMYFWGTDFAFNFPKEILLPILNTNVSSNVWYGINTAILILAHEGIIAAGYLQGRNKENSSLKKGLALTTASFATSILSYATITQALTYE